VRAHVSDAVLTLPSTHERHPDLPNVPTVRIELHQRSPPTRTVAVNVTLAPYTDGLPDVASAVVVLIY